jgi:prevent-host-death family protein
MKTISAGDANRHFSALLRDVATGETITVISRGKPVATIAPTYSGKQEQKVARQQLLSRLRQQIPAGARSWARNDLYED